MPRQKGRCKVSVLLACAQVQQSCNEMTWCINLLFVICCLLLVRFRTSSIFDAAVDPIQLKNVTFEHVKGVRSRVKCVQVLVLSNHYKCLTVFQKFLYMKWTFICIGHSKILLCFCGILYLIKGAVSTCWIPFLKAKIASGRP